MLFKICFIKPFNRYELKDNLIYFEKKNNILDSHHSIFNLLTL